MSNNKTDLSKYLDELKKTVVSAAPLNFTLSTEDIKNLGIGEELKPEPEEWIWVEGYKATDKNMVCRGKQYRMNCQQNMSEDAEIKDCESGFHFCRDLKDVFNYYTVQDGNRFFRVRALVRKKDYEEYGIRKPSGTPWGHFTIRDKLVSKSIIFLYELTAPEILKASPIWDKVKDYTEEEMKEAVEYNWGRVRERKDIEKLVAAGYSAAFSKYISTMSYSTVENALAVATQPELSMDMKVLAILREEYDD